MKIKAYSRLVETRDLALQMETVCGQIAEARLEALPGSPVISDMPKSHSHTWRDLSDSYSRVEDLLQKRASLEMHYMLACADAYAIIMEVPGEAARSYLEEYFILARSKAYIAAKHGISYQAVWQTINRALSA